MLLVLVSSSFRVSSSGHILYHRRRVLVVVGTYENGIVLPSRFYFCSFHKFLLVGFGVACRVCVVWRVVLPGPVAVLLRVKKKGRGRLFGRLD